MKSKLICMAMSCLLAGCETMQDSALAVDPYHYPYNSLSQSVPRDSILQQYSSDGSLGGENWSASFDDVGTQSVAPRVMHARAAPSSARQSDQDWASMQPSHAYTIKIAQNNQATQVAKVLYQAPKTARTAELSTQQGYVGVFGTYQTKEDAMLAMEKLPEAIRKDAQVMPWQDIKPPSS